MKMSTWLFRGVIKMSTFVHDGGGGVKFLKKLGTWFVYIPLRNVVCVV